MEGILCARLSDEANLAFQPRFRSFLGFGFREAVKDRLTCFSLCDYNVITQMKKEAYSVKTRLIRIGNSRGIRLPKAIISQAGLTEEVELGVRDGAVIIAPVAGPRRGWADAAANMRARDEDRLLDPPIPTHFDEKEWKW
jgi:antitoxin MazE